MIFVLATIRVVDGQRDAFLAEFRKLVPQVHAEDGCIEYGPAVDVSSGLAAQGAERPDVAVIIEKWRDLPALEAHLQAPHMHEYRQRVRHLVEHVELQILKPA
jgi:quinol monooxygenase YgiN